MDGHHLELQDEPRRITISIDGVTLAESTDAVALQETGLPVRYYFPREDVRMKLLVATPTETVCPFKGQASYWTLHIGDAEHRDVAWSYEQPIPGVERIAGLICFYAERVDTNIDGEPVERPESPWSKAASNS